MTYDSRADTLRHVEFVKAVLGLCAAILETRGRQHDQSKLEEPELSTFNEWTPGLRKATYGSPEYMAAVAAMGDGLKHHFQHNRHHPEHYEDGIAGMTLLDVLEMVCDWYARAIEQGGPVRLEESARRFGISPQLLQIIANTVEEFNQQFNGTGLRPDDA